MSSSDSQEFYQEIPRLIGPTNYSYPRDEGWKLNGNETTLGAITIKKMTKFGYLSAPVMTIIHKKTKEAAAKSQKTTFYVFETAPKILDYISVAPPLRGAGKFLPQTPSFYQKWAKKHCSNRKQTLMFVNNEQRSEMGKTES